MNMRDLIDVRGGKPTRRKHALRLVERRRARWISDSEIEIVVSVSAVSRCAGKLIVRPYVNEQQDVHSALPIIGYRRETSGRK